MNHTQHRRDLNTKEKSIALCVTIAIHYLIRRMDDLSHTSIFSLRIKQTGKAFLSALELHSRRTVWDGQVDGADLNQASQQADDCADFMHNMFIVADAVSGVPAGQKELFWAEMQKNFKRFDMPIRMTPEGILETIDREEVIEV